MIKRMVKNKYLKFMFVSLCLGSYVFGIKKMVLKSAEVEKWDYTEHVEDVRIKVKKSFKTPFPNFKVTRLDSSGKVLNTYHTGSIDKETCPKDHSKCATKVHQLPLAFEANVGDTIKIQEVDSILGSGNKINRHDMQIFTVYEGDDDPVQTGSKPWISHQFKIENDKTRNKKVKEYGIFLNVGDNYSNNKIPGFANWSEYGNWRTIVLEPKVQHTSSDNRIYEIEGWYFVGVKIVVKTTCENLEYAKGHVPECCNELYYIHHMNGSVNIENYLNKTGVSCCESLRNIIPFSLYEGNCIDKIELNKCNYNLDVLCPEDCYNNNEGHVKDIGEDNNYEEWQCIFDSKNSLYPEVRSHYQWTGGGLLGNPYCEVYCREEIDYKLPKDGFTVKAGHHFTVGYFIKTKTINSWGPIEFSGLQECRTKGNDDTMIINHEQFVKDYEEADKKTLEKWKDWQYAIAWNGSVDNAGTSSSTCCCNVCGKNEDGSDIECPCAATEHNPTEYCFGGEEDKNYCATASSWKTGSCCDDSSPEKDEDDYEDEYLKAYNERAGYLEKIEKCNEWIRGYGTFEPNIQIQYEEDKYGFKFGEIKNGMSISWLKANLVKKKQNFLFYEGSKYDKKSSYSYSETELITTHICEKPNGDYNTGEFCVDEPKEYPINDNREEIDKKKYVYTLADNVYRYVSKPKGESLLKKPINNIQYIDMGFPNLPIHYSRVPSDLSKEKYDLDLRLLSFGPSNKFNNYIFKSKRFAGRRYQCDPTTTGYFDYECDYEVDNEFMYCSKTKCKDIQVVFRQVSLSHPFITADGNERSPGENWYNNEEYITKNRNLSVPERIYFDRDPMYEITLNTETIARIRNYNRNTKDGYSDFNLKCIVGEGRECKSQFIRKEFSSSFVSKWCGMSSDWDRCEKDDE